MLIPSLVLILAQPGGPTDRISVLFPILHEDGSRIQPLKHYDFIYNLDNVQKPRKQIYRNFSLCNNILNDYPTFHSSGYKGFLPQILHIRTLPFGSQ